MTIYSPLRTRLFVDVELKVLIVPEEAATSRAHRVMGGVLLSQQQLHSNNNIRDNYCTTTSPMANQLCIMLSILRLAPSMVDPGIGEPGNTTPATR